MDNLNIGKFTVEDLRQFIKLTEKAGGDTTELKKQLQIKMRANLVKKLEAVIKNNLVPCIKDEGEPLTLAISYEPSKSIQIGLIDEVPQMETIFEWKNKKTTQQKPTKKEGKKTKGPTKHLKVDFLNGKVIEGKKGVETLVEFIETIGPYKAADAIKALNKTRNDILYITPTVPKGSEAHYRVLSNGEFLMVNDSNPDKKDLMEAIAKHLGVEVVINMSENPDDLTDSSDDESDESEVDSKKATIRVTMEDGTMIQGKDGVEGFVKLVEHVGPDMAKLAADAADIMFRGKVPLIGPKVEELYSKRQKLLSDDQYLVTDWSNEDKMIHIRTILHNLDQFGAKVELVQRACNRPKNIGGLFPECGALFAAEAEEEGDS